MKSLPRARYIVIALLLVSLVIVPSVRDPERKDLTADARALFPGNYVELDQGNVRYQLTGPANAPLVVLVGGLTTSLELFDGESEFLNAAGYRTLSFDLFGRGGSDRPSELAYDQAMFNRQLSDLLSALDISTAVHLVGQSLGGGIVVSWAAQNPEKVLSLFLQSSAGYLAEPPAMLGVLKTPLVGDYLWWLVGNTFILSGVDSYFVDKDKTVNAADRVRTLLSTAFEFKGYRHAVLETIRNFSPENMERPFTSVGANSVPIQIVWGRDDTTIPVSNVQQLRTWLDDRPQVTILENVGHMPMLESPDAVHSLLLVHLNGVEAGRGQ